MSGDIEILYVDKSNDESNSTVLVFAKPTELNSNSFSQAWQVIENIGYNSWHKFFYTSNTEIQALWDNGRSGTFPIEAVVGKNYSLKETPSGFALEEDGTSSAPNQFSVTNQVSTPGGISVVALKDGKPIAIAYGVSREEKAEFEFNLQPKIYFGVVSQQKGDVVDSTVMSELKEVSLEGLANVTVTMKGDAANGYTFEVSDTVAA
ncbi:hypothetical protein NIES22_69170 (plasmid) [Calothrix brevissima NIES-22]|nr:hypothetical protein NIES22_69170 [Calothrix brevissima NIES-22]